MKRNTLPSALCECAAYIPVYEGGNSVMAVKKDGDTGIINMGIKSVINTLLRENSIDIRALRRNFSDVVRRTNLIPITLGIDRVLIPLKVRKIIGVNDGAYGYIDLSYIDAVTGDNKAVIKLKCSREINCLETVKTVKNMMKMGDIVKDKFASRMMGEWSLRDGVSAASSEYGRPATKGDLCMLAYEIMELRNMIKGKGE